jgi:hypothetical protein
VIGTERDPAPADAPELRACLRELFGPELELVGDEQIKGDVHRLRIDVDGAARSLIAKWSDPMVARRNWLVAHRWLPAVGLQAQGPPLLAVAAAPSWEGAWHVYDDLPGRPLSSEQPIDGDVEAAIDAIARVHTAFAEHELLPECRLWGGDRGFHFYSSSLRDAVIALGSLDRYGSGSDTIALRDALRERIERLEEREPERRRILAAWGGPETLLHGDLWPTNALVIANGDGVAVRLVDWDEAAVGPVGFDVSTFLLRFDPPRRPWILESYRRAVERLAGWQLPGEHDLNQIFATAAHARLVSLLVWSVAAAAEDDSDWLPERLAELIEWLDSVEPVLPEG